MRKILIDEKLAKELLHYLYRDRDKASALHQNKTIKDTIEGYDRDICQLEAAMADPHQTIRDYLDEVPLYELDDLGIQLDE